MGLLKNITNKYTSKISLFLILTIFIIMSNTLIFCGEAKEAGNIYIKEKFIKTYETWKKFMNSPESKALSDSTGITTVYYKEIIKLGIPAIPDIMEKMKEDPSLWYAVRIITKKWFEKNERKNISNNIAKLYLDWWYSDRLQTFRRFNQLYSDWQSLKKQGKTKEADEKYQRIKDLGIDALPSIIQKVEQGDKDLIPVVSYLTDNNVKSDTKPADCLNWWNSNKDKWTLPPVK